jgi:hypothetical protein
LLIWLSYLFWRQRRSTGFEPASYYSLCFHEKDILTASRLYCDWCEYSKEAQEEIGVICDGPSANKINLCKWMDVLAYRCHLYLLN